MRDFVLGVLDRHRKAALLLVAGLAVANGVLFSRLAADARATGASEFDFLDVGQGDAELLQIADGGGKSTLLVDGGPADGKVGDRLRDVLPPMNDRIDLVAMTHADADHSAGLIDVVRTRDVGAFLWAGRAGETAEWAELLRTLKEKHVPMIALVRGDRVRIGADMIDVVSPDAPLLASKDLNDACLVLRADVGGVSALLTGDIGKKAEQDMARLGGLIRSDVVKVPHHGSKGSLDASFLNAVSPRIAVIEVGKNSYGQPTPEALDAYGKLGARMFRTDRDGTVRLVVGADRKMSVEEVPAR